MSICRGVKHNFLTDCLRQGPSEWHIIQTRGWFIFRLRVTDRACWHVQAYTMYAGHLSRGCQSDLTSSRWCGTSNPHLRSICQNTQGIRCLEDEAPEDHAKDLPVDTYRLSHSLFGIRPSIMPPSAQITPRPKVEGWSEHAGAWCGPDTKQTVW